LREALARLITDPELRLRLGRRAIEVSRTFGLDRWRQQWTRVLKAHLPEDLPRAEDRPPVALFLNANYIVWERMKQRPHHLASQLAARGLETFWVNATGRRESPRPNLHLIDPEDDLYLENPLVVLYYPFDEEVIGQIERQCKDPMLVYDVLDSIEIHPGQRAQDNHERLLDRADMVVASSRALYDLLKDRRPDTVYVPNGVDRDHFATAAPREQAADLARLPRPVIGYYGALAEWFDYDLLRRAAVARPRYQFVLIGPATQPDELDGLLRLPNVRHLGEKSYEELPGYVSAFDVGILTFRQYEVTRCVRPLKVLEYLAAGKPVVSTRLPDMADWPGVLMADDAEGFVGCLDRALNSRETFWDGRAVADFIDKESWDSICRPWLDELLRIHQARRPFDQKPIIRRVDPRPPASLAG
jgi:glycosyltransferase involved in cell wall biosynthesis